MNTIKQQLKTAYDKDAKRRDATGEREQWKRDVRDQFIELLKTNDKKTILELGAGAGFDSKYFLDKGYEVLATDLSVEMVKVCKNRGLNAKVTDLYDLPALGMTFDAIYSLNVLLHVPRNELDAILKIIYETLNDGGIFFYGVYGGVDKEETITDASKMNLPRFFSFLSDKALLEIAKKRFQIVDFKTINVNGNKQGLHFQSLLLKK